MLDFSLCGGMRIAGWCVVSVLRGWWVGAEFWLLQGDWWVSRFCWFCGCVCWACGLGFGQWLCFAGLVGWWLGCLGLVGRY